MNTAVLTRVLSIAAGVFLIIAIAAYTATMITGSARFLAAGNLGATLAVVLFLGRVTARYARLISYWQADVAAVGHGTPRPVVPDPRESPETGEVAPGDAERARRGDSPSEPVRGPEQRP